MGVHIFCEKSKNHWYSKRQSTVESTIFGADICSTKTEVELSKALRYRLHMCGAPIDGPTSVFCDNEIVYKSPILPESTSNKK